MSFVGILRMDNHRWNIMYGTSGPTSSKRQSKAIRRRLHLDITSGTKVWQRQRRPTIMFVLNATLRILIHLWECFTKEVPAETLLGRYCWPRNAGDFGLRSAFLEGMKEFELVLYCFVVYALGARQLTKSRSTYQSISGLATSWASRAAALWIGHLLRRFPRRAVKVVGKKCAVADPVWHGPPWFTSFLLFCRTPGILVGAMYHQQWENDMRTYINPCSLFWSCQTLTSNKMMNNKKTYETHAKNTDFCILKTP